MPPGLAAYEFKQVPMSLPPKSKLDAQAYEPLGLKEGISYTLGDVGINLYWAPITAFLMIYLTDVVGLAMKDVGLLFVVVRLVGAAAEPVFAAIADRTHTNFGRYRVWFLWLSVPMAAAGVLIFSTSNVPDEGKLALSYVCFILFNLIYTAVSVPYNALSGVITPDSRQREVLLSARFGAAFLTAVLVTWITPKIVAFAAPHDLALGWQFTMTLYGAIAFVVFLNLFLNTRERFSLITDPHPNPLLDVRDLFRNRPWIVLFGLGFIVMLAFTIHTGVTPYYIKYYVGRPDLLTLFAMLFMLGLAGGSAVTAILTRLVTKSQLIAGMLAVTAVSSIGLYLTPAGNVPLIFTLQVLTGVSLGTVSTITFAMYADAADLNAWKTGKRATAMTYSLITFAKKIGTAIAAALVTWAFAKGYAPNVQPSAGLLDNIRLMIGLVPALLFLLGAVVACIYNLDAEAVRRYRDDLFSRLRSRA